MSRETEEKATQPVSLEDVRRRMGNLCRMLGRARLESKFFGLVIVEHHLPREANFLSISLFGIARTVAELLGSCQSMLLDGASMTEATAKRDLAAVADELEAAIKAWKEANKKGGGILDELIEAERRARRQGHE